MHTCTNSISNQDASVGKSNLVLRFCDGSFEEDYRFTLGVDFKFRTVQYHDILVKAQGMYTCVICIQLPYVFDNTVWDTAGQDRYRSITSAYYRSADGLILCYDITKKSSFENLSEWLCQIRKYTTNAVVLVGLKKDAETSREVQTVDAQRFADKHSLPFMEVSAKTSEHVDELFLTVTDCVMEEFLKRKPKTTISIEDEGYEEGSTTHQTRRRKRKCCK